MKNANTHGTTTPVVATPGASSEKQCDCLISQSVVNDELQHSISVAAGKGPYCSANAYERLSNLFHKAVLPAFIHHTRGNSSEIARLMGLSRSTVIKYAQEAGLGGVIGMCNYREAKEAADAERELIAMRKKRREQMESCGGAI